MLYPMLLNLLYYVNINHTRSTGRSLCRSGLRQRSAAERKGISLKNHSPIHGPEKNVRPCPLPGVSVPCQESPPPLSGIEYIRHLQAAELLTSWELPEDARQIVVVGGGATGCEVACRLASEPGRKIHVVEMLPNFMEGVCAARRNRLIRQLEQAGVDLVNCARVTNFADGVVYIERNVADGIPDPYNTHQPMLPKNIPTPLAGEPSDGIYIDQLTADLVVLATGNSGRQLLQEALALKAADEIYDIASETGAEAEEAAYQLACRL